MTKNNKGSLFVFEVGPSVKFVSAIKDAIFNKKNRGKFCSATFSDGKKGLKNSGHNTASKHDICTTVSRLAGRLLQCGEGGWGGADSGGLLSNVQYCDWQRSSGLRVLRQV